MEPVEFAKATRSAVSGVGSKFMVDARTYKRGAELGFEGIDFYLAGRGGVLGDVPADVLTAALFYFEESHVRAAWERTGLVTSRSVAGTAFAEAGYDWARQHLADVDPEVTATVVTLGSRVVADVSPAGAPLFAAWRLLGEPSDAPAAALHVMNALRELRAAYHGGAILAQGLAPVEALAMNSPGMAGIFGWSDLPPVDGLQSAWQSAEDATDVAMARALSVIDDRDRQRFVDACDALNAAP